MRARGAMMMSVAHHNTLSVWNCIAPSDMPVAMLMSNSYTHLYLRQRMILGVVMASSASIPTILSAVS